MCLPLSSTCLCLLSYSYSSLGHVLMQFMTAFCLRGSCACTWAGSWSSTVYSWSRRWTGQSWLLGFLAAWSDGWTAQPLWSGSSPHHYLKEFAYFPPHLPGVQAALEEVVDAFLLPPAGCLGQFGGHFTPPLRCLSTRGVPSGRSSNTFQESRVESKTGGSWRLQWMILSARGAELETCVYHHSERRGRLCLGS